MLYGITIYWNCIKQVCINPAKFKLMNIIPYKELNQGFSLLELLAAMVIALIVAGISVSSYKFYSNKALVNSMWGEAEEAKLAVESSYLKQNTGLSGLTFNSGSKEYTTPTSASTKCITIQNGIVSVVGKPTSFGGLNVWIAWTPSVSTGTLTWACTYSSDATEYLGDSATSCSVGTAAYSADSACN